MKPNPHRLRKSVIMTLIVAILILPVPLSFSTCEEDQQIPKVTDSLFREEEKLQQYLFSYQKGEENLIKEFLQGYYDRNPSFFQNLNIGMVSLTEHEINMLKNQESFLASRLHLSKQIRYLPSLESLLPKQTSVLQQSSFDLPSDVVNATPNYENGYDGEGIKIAILDSGIDSSHSDVSNIAYEESFVTSEYGYSSNESTDDQHGHGTHVAGIAAGSGDDYPGVAYNAQLVNLKVADMFGGATEVGLIAALNRSVAEEVDVVSISLGFDLSTPFDTDDILTRAVNSAVDQGISVIVSAGNEAVEPVPQTTIGSPAAASKVISVGATNGSEEVVSFSSRGPTLNYRVDPDIVAPGYQIVGPLAYGGVLERAYNALVGIYISRYIVLSGTSMSAPVVSGSVALLKQEFPDASPHALRAALLESATDLEGDETIYTQGSGLINVGKAANLLSQSKVGSEYELISSLPRASEKPLEFFHPLVFPGDKAQMRLSLMTGSGGAVTWEVSDSLYPFIEFDTTPTLLNSSDYFEKDIKLEIPLNMPIGSYSGYIRYTAFGKSYDILIDFNIQKPRVTIYWDSYHTGRDDSFLYNYRTLDEILQEPSYNYDIIDHYTPIFGGDLSQSDILVLTDMEYTFGEEEMNIIKEFHEKNGTIILLTSFFPYYNLDPYYELTSLLNLPINFSNQVALVEYLDNGRDKEFIPSTIDLESLNFDENSLFFDGVNTIPNLGGTAFVGSLVDPTVVDYLEYNDLLLLAGIEPTKKGKVLVLGSEQWLLPSYLSTSSGLTFLSNILSWLTPERPTSNIKVDYDTSSIELAIYSTQIKNYSFTITYKNGTTVPGYEIKYNSTLGFNYLNLTVNESYFGNIRFNFEPTEALAPILIEFMNPLSLPDILEIEVTTSSNVDLEYPTWADSDLELMNEALEVSFNHTESSSVFAKLIVSSHSEKTVSELVPPRYSLTSYKNESMFVNISNTQKSAKWYLPLDNPVGYYAYEIQVWLNTSFGFPTLFHSERKFVYVPDAEPVLMTSQSSVGGVTFDEHDEMDWYNIWSPDENIEINIHVSDNADMLDGEVHFQLLHFYLYAADRTVLANQEINHQNSSHNIFSGTFVIPSEPIPLPGEDYEVEIDYEIFVLLFFIRDAQGNFIVESFFFMISNPFTFDFSIFIGPILIGILVIIVIIFFIRRNSRNRLDKYSYRYSTYQPQVPASYETPKASTKFCIHCGENIPRLATFCSFCGKNVDF